MTNNIALRTAEEFMQDYKPTYKALYPLLMKNSQAYPQVVGQLNFRRATTVGDIRAKRQLPKQSHIHQISVADGKKTFSKYFNAAQFVESTLQDQQGKEDIIKEVLDENEKLQDQLMLFGEGTSSSNMLNNGLYWSNDVNYLLETAIASVAAASSGYHLPALHTAMSATIAKADLLDGEKVMVIYGALTLAKFDSLYSTSDRPFKAVLGENNPDWKFLRMPPDVTPAGAEGWIAVNLDQIKVNYTIFPSLVDQDVDRKNMQSWHNFLMGSMMVEVKVKNGIIRQPVTAYA